jgi:hypothetical protein
MDSGLLTNSMALENFSSKTAPTTKVPSATESHRAKAATCSITAAYTKDRSTTMKPAARESIWIPSRTMSITASGRKMSHMAMVRKNSQTDRTTKAISSRVARKGMGIMCVNLGSTRDISKRETSTAKALSPILTAESIKENGQMAYFQAMVFSHGQTATGTKVNT